MARNAAEKRQWYDGRLGLHCILTFLCFTKEPIGRIVYLLQDIFCRTLGEDGETGVGNNRSTMSFASFKTRMVCMPATTALGYLDDLVGNDTSF